MELLKTMYTVFSPSWGEEQMGSIVKRELNLMKIPYKEDAHGQIYAINENQPLLSAHLDQVTVGKPPIKVYENRGFLYGDGHLGADDKNGVWLVLKLLAHDPKCSFIFSVGEEAGGNVSKITSRCNGELKTIPFALVFDRKGSGDIIGTDNNYCCDDLEDVLTTIGRAYGYKPASGVWSDANELSYHMPTVNLSCGYYNAHTVKEYTKIADLENALDYAKTILDYCERKRYDLPDKIAYGYRSGSVIWDDYEEWMGEGRDNYDQFEDGYTDQAMSCPSCFCNDVFMYYDHTWCCEECGDSGKTYTTLISDGLSVMKEAV